MKYIKVFTDFVKVMEPLADAERGRLFTAMLHYAQLGSIPEFCGNERFVWPTAKLQIDRDTEQYADFVKKQSDNGAMGGRPRKEKNPKYPGLRAATQKSQDKDKDKDQDQDKDQDKDQPQEPSPMGTWGVDSVSLLTALQEFEVMRNRIKSPMTALARKLLLNSLRKLSAEETVQIAMLEQSILHGWKSVYRLTPERRTGAVKTAADYADEEESLI